MEEEGHLQSLLRWAAEIGISDSSNRDESSSTCVGQSIFVSSFPDAGGRGLAAARDLRKGEMVLKVPKSALLTRESVLLKDKRLEECLKSYPNLSSNQVLTICLLSEVGKGRGSWWHLYLMHLPRYYNTLSSFTHEEIQALQVDDAIWTAEKTILKTRSDWKEVQPLMQGLKFHPRLISFRSWLWASATISSRALHIPWDNAGCLCPVGDLFNYAAPDDSNISEDKEPTWKDLTSLVDCCSSWETVETMNKDRDDNCRRLTDGGYEEDRDAYCFYARRRYTKGEQVLLEYGTYTNLELLEYYGFLLDANPNDKAFIELDPDIYSLSSWPRGSMYIQQDGKPSFVLLSSLRLWKTPMNLRKMMKHLVYSGSQLSIENETSVFRWIEKCCREYLDKMPTSIEEDSPLLESIINIQGHQSTEEILQMLNHAEELHEFLKGNGLLHAGGTDFVMQKKVLKSIERLKLAIEWRLRYKKMFLDCISFCNNRIHDFDVKAS